MRRTVRVVLAATLAMSAALLGAGSHRLAFASGGTAVATESPTGAPLKHRHVVAQVTPAFLVGAWETINIEFDKSVRIIWTLWGDGRLLYHFDTPEGFVRGATGSWSVEGNVVREDWLRPDGSQGAGQGTIEKIDEDTIRLTIVDNGHPQYKGISRVYRRLGEPKLSDASRAGLGRIR